jgi:hypothetical protein
MKKDSFEMLAKMSNNMLEIIAEVNILRDSLQKEFEYFAAHVDLFNTVEAKKIEAKKRQQLFVEIIKRYNSNNLTLLNQVSDYIFKLEACLIFHGVEPVTIEKFCAQSKSIVWSLVENEQLKKLARARMVSNLTFDLEYTAKKIVQNLEPKEYKFAAAPVYDWSKFKRV